MREATKEEKESVINYVESISVDTGINFYAIRQGGECTGEKETQGEWVRIHQNIEYRCSICGRLLTHGLDKNVSEKCHYGSVLRKIVTYDIRE